MARQASRTVIRQGLGLKWLVVGIVAGSAPQSAAAVADAGAQGKLFDVANDLESASGYACWFDIVVGGECAFQALPWDEIAKLFSGIEDASGPKQMALLADTVASGRFELRGIDDCACTGIC